MILHGHFHNTIKLDKLLQLLANICFTFSTCELTCECDFPRNWVVRKSKIRCVWIKIKYTSSIKASNSVIFLFPKNFVKNTGKLVEDKMCPAPQVYDTVNFQNIRVTLTCVYFYAFHCIPKMVIKTLKKLHWISKTNL